MLEKITDHDLRPHLFSSKHLDHEGPVCRRRQRGSQAAENDALEGLVGAEHLLVMPVREVAQPREGDTSPVHDEALGLA